MRTILTCCAIALVAFGGCQTTPSKSVANTVPTTKPAGRVRPTKPAMEHQRTAFDAAELRRGWLRSATFDDARGGVVIRDPADDFPFAGVWMSDTIKPNFAFTELLPSWNVIVEHADQAGIRFDVRIRDDASGEWSPWLYMGYWGRSLRDKRVTEFAGGKIDIDTLELSKPADAFEIRATLQKFQTTLATPALSPVLKEISVVTSKKRDADSGPTSRPAWKPINLPVPFRAQGWEVDSIKHSVCSPTSVSMVLEWAGTPRATAENCMAIWDDEYALFGNWNRAVQLAGSLGHEAYLDRYATMDQARATLSSGQPLIASIRFKKGEFPSNIQKSTAGHLIVLRGVDANGDIICNDPASKDRGNGVVYKADELGRAWIGSTGGVAYVIKKKAKPTSQPTN
jgi:hypothetical protein